VFGVVALTNVTILFLKLISYIHFWYDVRLFFEKRARLIKKDREDIQHDIYKEIEEVLTLYPKNLTFSNLIMFIFMPVLCYQYKYPRTHRIRKSNVLNYLAQFICCLLLLMYY
jgi:hypothetical protein